jgi:hypothetical protein
MTAGVVAEWCAYIRTYGTCTVRIQQEPMPVLAGPIFYMVDGCNLYSHNRIQVWWPVLPGTFGVQILICHPPVLSGVLAISAQLVKKLRENFHAEHHIRMGTRLMKDVRRTNEGQPD